MRQKKLDNFWEKWQNGNNQHETNRFWGRKIIRRIENKETNQRERTQEQMKKRKNGGKQQQQNKEWENKRLETKQGSKKK